MTLQPGAGGSDRTIRGYRAPPAAPAGEAAGGLAPAARDAALRIARELQPPLEPGEIGRLGNYRVLRPLGAGGMGVVFAAEDLTLARPVALKVMNPGVWDRERFLREARAMATLKHENLVTVYQAGEQGDAFYIAMELLEGETLHDRVRREGPLPPAEVLRVARETAAGLAAIHRKGLLHRDVKPHNVWLESPGDRVRILDLGLARPTDAAVPLTQSGLVVGTPAFMAPEQARGLRMDARSDLFSLGCVLHHVSTGVPPFRGDSVMAQLTALAVDTPAPLTRFNPRISRGLSDLVARLLSKDPARRPATAEAVIAELDAIERGRRATSGPRASRTWLPVAALAAAGVVAFLVVRGLLSSDPADPPPAPGAPSPFAALPPPEREPPAPPEADGPAQEPPEGDLGPPAREPPPSRIGRSPIEPMPGGARPPPGARVAFLVDMAEGEMVNVWFPSGSGKPGRPMSPAPPGAFRELAVGSEVSPHGIGMHPVPGGGPAVLVYRLDGRYRTFRGGVALNNGPRRSDAPMTFSVLVDGKTAWSSRPIRSQEGIEPYEVSVAGARELRLELAAEGEPKGAHGLWFEPRLEE